MLGCALLALASGLTVWFHPGWLGPVLAVDVLVLSSQHVIATYSRICFDQASFRRYRFLVLGAPWLVIAFVLAVFSWGGVALVTTLYMYIQWFHYVGQGYAVERMYACKSGPPETPFRFDLLALLATAGVPLYGLLHRSLQKSQNPEKVYLTFNFTPLPVTPEMLAFCGLLALGLCLAWLIRQHGHYRRYGPATLPHAAYMGIHWLIFLTGYYLIEDITSGWLVLNVWHNLQYVLMVWLYNNNRFGDRLDRNAYTLSYLSQSKRFLHYFVICIVLAGVFYKLVALVDGWLVNGMLRNHERLFSLNPEFFKASGLVSLNLVPNSSSLAAAVAMLSYQVINLHHYLVDATVWRVGQKENHVGLGLTASTPESGRSD